MENKIDEMRMRYRILQEINKSLSSTIDLNILGNLILDLIIDILNVSSGSLFIYDKSDGILKMLASRGIPQKVSDKISIIPGKGICGKIFKNKIPVFVKDISKNKRFKPTGRARYRDKSFISFPLIVADEAIGIININNSNKQKGLLQEDFDMVKEIVPTAAISLKNAMLVKKINSIKEYIEKIFMNVNTGIITVDNKLRIFEINESAKTILNLKNVPDNLKKISINYKDMINIIKGTIKHKKYLKKEEINVKNKNKTQLINLSLNRLDLTSSNSQWIINIEDVTWIKKIEEEIFKSSREKYIGDMYARIAHEIRNPLSLVGGFVDIIEEKVRLSYYESKDIIGKNVIIIKKEIKRLDKLLQDMLDFSRPLYLAPKNIKLSEVINYIGEFFADDFKDRNITFNLKIKQDADIYLDSDRLFQIIFNIINNSSESVDKGKISLTADKTDDKIIIEIRDNGCGIKKSNINKIFEPFFTTKTHGTGLGLSVTKKVIETMGGSISIKSDRGIGTNVRLEIPCMDI